MTDIEFAEVCERAVNECLSDGCEELHDKWGMTCNAVSKAARRDELIARARLDKVEPNIGRAVDGAFHEFAFGPERQYARALWLTLLAHVARAGDLP